MSVKSIDIFGEIERKIDRLRAEIERVRLLNADLLAKLENLCDEWWTVGSISEQSYKDARISITKSTGDDHADR